MDKTCQLDAIAELVSYSGLEQNKALEYLEQCDWNVEMAYKLYKAQKMSQTPFINNQHSRCFQPVVMRPAVTYVRPIAAFPQNDGYGAAVFRMGPAAVGNLHQSSYQHNLPAFPVEQHRDTVIPIQIEIKPLVQRQPSHSCTLPHQPDIAKRDATTRCTETMTKSQSYPVHITGNHLQANNALDDKECHIHALKSEENVKANHFQEPALCRFNDKGEELLASTEISGSFPDSTSPKVLKRGISKISQNASLVEEERKNVLHDIVEDCHDNMYVQTFVLPDVTGYTDEFREFLEKDLIETSTLVSLEQAGRLNWWTELGVCQRLLPMATSGDGNCLLHAASLAMWGIHDRLLLLRKALYDTLTKKHYKQALYRRWRWQQTQAYKQAGLIFSEDEWKTEWENVLHLASSTPRSLPGTAARNNSCCESVVTQPSNMSSSKELETEPHAVYESLEEFHVFVLAHIIQRPIIVVADTILRDTSGEAMAPIPFGGIYLPLECEPSHCHRSPLLLTYDAAHFSALVPMERVSSSDDKNSLPVAIPIVSTELTTLPLHFAIDPGIDFNWQLNKTNFLMSEEKKLNLLKQYLDLEKLPICGSYSDSNSDKNSTGSYESDDGLIEKVKKKDRVSQQLYSVSKQFGSFGKSVGKKIKNLGKGNKDEKKGLHKLIGNNAKVPFSISALYESEQQSIWCCKINIKKSETHQKMIDNYLYDAGERFKQEINLSRLRKIESVHISRKCSEPSRTHCITAGCPLYGTVEYSYLCSKCYADQKRHMHGIDHAKDHDRNRQMENGCHHKQNSVCKDAAKFGKSKFYDMNNPDVTDDITYKLAPVSTGIQSKVDAVLDSNQNTGLSNSPPVQTRTSSVKVRERTPSPDYDNVDYGPTHVQSKSPSPIPSISQNSALVNQRVDACKCLNPACDFYGSKETAFFCSWCFKNKKVAI